MAKVCEWVSMESSRDPEVPCVKQVLQPLLTMASDFADVPIELPSGIFGIL